MDYEVVGDQGEITLDFQAFDAATLPGEGAIYYDTEDCCVHVALSLLAGIVNSEAEAGYKIDVNAALIDNYEFDFDKAGMYRADTGLSFANGEIVIASNGFVELTEGERLLRVRATGLTELKEAQLATEGATIEVIEGNVPLGSEASYTAHTSGETAELVENYINNEENGDVAVAGYSAADLKIVRNDETLPVEGQFKVTVDKESLVPAGMKLDKLYHIHRDENDEAVVEELAFEETEAGLVFELANFSDIVAKYTVEFHNGDAQVVIKGGSQVLLSALIGGLGLTRVDGSTFTVDDVDKVEFATPDLFDVREVLNGEEITFDNGVEETVVIVTEHDFLITSLKPFDEDWMILTLKDGTLIVVRVTDDNEGSYLVTHTTTVKFYNADAVYNSTENRITSPDSYMEAPTPALNDYYYALAWFKREVCNEESGKYEEKAFWNVQPIAFRELGENSSISVSFSNGFKSEDPDDKGTYDLLNSDYGADGTGLKTRIWHSSSNISVNDLEFELNESENKGLLSSATGASIDENIEPLHNYRGEKMDSSTQSNIIYVQNTNHYTYRIRLRFDPESVNPLQGEGDGTSQDNGRYYYVLARIKHRSGDYSYAYEKINVPDPTLLPVDDDGYYYIDYDYGYNPTTHTYKNWKPFQTETVTSFFTGLEEKIEVKVVQSWKKDGFIPQALISDSAAGPLTNDLRKSPNDGAIFEEGDAVRSYNVHYDTKASRGGSSNYRTMREGNVIICYDTINLSSNSVTSDYDYTTILGPNMVYGIVAEHLYQPNHLQTNFAVNHFSAHGHDVRPDLSGPNSGNIVIAQFNESDGSRRNSVGNVAYDPTWGRLKVGKPLNGTLMVYVDQDSGYSENGQLANVYDNPGQTVVIPTDGQSLSENIVEPGIEYGKRMSAILASKGANVSATIQGNKAIIDTRDYPENATIYVNADLIRSYIGRSGGLEINKKDNQTIIFNFTDDVDSREVTINQFVVKQPSFANYGYSNGYKTESPEATGSDQNKVMDDIARHIVWNLRGCLRKVTIDTAGGIFLQPNDNSEIEIKGTTAGWIVSDGYVYNGTAEWHNVFEEMPDGVQVNLYALKYVNDKMPSKDEKFTFKLEQYKFEYSSIDAEGKVDANWVTLNSTTTNDYSLVKFPTLTQDDLKLGWNIFRIKEVGKADSTDGSYVTDQTEYYAAVLLQRYSIHDEEDSRKIKLEYTVSQPRFFKSWNEDNYKPYNSDSYTDINTVPTGVYGERVAIPSFKNEKTVTGLTLTKRVNGTDDTHQSFTFRVTLWTETTDNGVTTRHPLSMSSLTVTGVTGKSVALTHETDHSYADITLKNGRKVVIKDLPAGVHYSIVEYKIGDTVVTDPSQAIGHYKPVPVGEDGEHNPIYAIVDEMETNNDSKVAAFYNDYDASGSINLNVVKTLTNEDAEPVALTEGQFIFTLSGNSTSVRGYNLASNEEAPGKAAQVVFRFNGENEAPTAALNFTQADMAGATKNEAGYYTKEITYILHESEGTRAGFDYDSVVYPEDKVITLVLTDMGDGTIDVKVKDTNDTTVGLTFENTQKKKAQATLQGTKTMEGREMTKAEFIFNAKLVKVGLDNVSDAAIAAAVSAAAAEGATDEQKAEPDRLRNLRKQASPVNVIGFNGKADTPDEEGGTSYTSDITFPTISYTEPGAYVYEITEDTSSMPEDARQKVGSTKTWYAKVVVAPNMTAVVTYCDTIDGTYTATPTPNFVNEEKKIGFKVTKLWDDQEGSKAEGPKEITFSLTHNNTDKVLNAVLAAHVAKENGTSGSVEVVGDTVKLTSDASGNWPTAVFTEMPAGRYQVKEESHSATASGSVVTTYTLPNPTDDDPDGVRNSSIVRDGETLTINNKETQDTYTNITVNKVWTANGQAYVPTSGSATFELYEVKTASGSSGSGIDYCQGSNRTTGAKSASVTVRYSVDCGNYDGLISYYQKLNSIWLNNVYACESVNEYGHKPSVKQLISAMIPVARPAYIEGDQATVKAAVPDPGAGNYTINLEFDIPIPTDTEFTVGAIWVQAINNMNDSCTVSILSKTEGVVRRFTLNKANNWSWNSGSLPMSKEDGAVTWQYYLKEVNVPDHFTVTYSPAGTDGKSGKITSAGSATITATNAQDDIVDLKVKKAWNPVEVPAGAEIELSLYAGKTAAAALATEPMRTITLDGTAGEVDSDHNQESPAWQANFKNLPKYGTDGTELVYIVKETEGVEGYAVKYDESGEATYVLASDSTEVDEDTATITNEQLGNGSLKITKSEVDVTNTLGNEPRTYKLAVKDSEGKYYNQNGTEAANQEAAWVTFTLPSETATDYTKTWENLPTGFYTVEEEAVDKTGYLWTVTGLGEVRVAPGVETEHAVVNTFDTLTTDVPVTKTWSDSYSGNWSATFALKVSKRLYSVDGVVKRYSSAHVGWSAFEAVTETVTIEEQEVMRPVTLTITNESVDPKFAEQPKYETDPVTGNVYELKYTADETEFTTGNGKTYTLQGISEATRQADGTFNAIEAVNTPDGKTQVKVEKVWSDGTVNHGDVTLRLVRYKAGVPTQKLRINHTVSGLDSFPAGFVATYTVSGGPTVIDNPVNGGEYDVEPGTYTVAVNVTNPAAPTEKVYNGTSPDSVDVTITREQGGTAAFVSSYGDKQYGNLQIRHGVSGQDSLPAGFSATYTISNGSTVVVANAEAETDYRLEAGISYTVTATVSGETVANYYASTNSPNAIVVAGERVYADVTTSYTWAGGYLTFTHVADPASATLPSGITYTVSGPTTISNPVPGTEYPVAAGEYTVTASGVGNISGYTRNATQNDESKGVTVAVGQHASVALTSHYTKEASGIKYNVSIWHGRWNLNNTTIDGWNNKEVDEGSTLTIRVKAKGTLDVRSWDEGKNYNWDAHTINAGSTTTDGEYSIYIYTINDIQENKYIGIMHESSSDEEVEITASLGNISALAASPFQLAFNPFVAYADEDHSTISEMASAGYGRDASFNRTVDVGVSNDWTALITGLDVYDEYGQPYYYGIEEVDVPEGFTVRTSDPWNAEAMRDATQTVTLTATNTPIERFTSIVVDKQWFYDGAQVSNYSDVSAIYFNIYKDGSNQPYNDSPYSITAADRWTWNSGDLPLGTYTVKECNSNGNEITTNVTYANNGQTGPSTHIVIKNTLTDCEGEKRWDDKGVADIVHPAITLRLKKTVGGTTSEVGSYVIQKNASGSDLKHKWTNLPAVDYATGNAITYSVDEDAVTGFTKSVSGNVVTNTLETIDVEAVKTWTGGTWPADVTVSFQLKQNGTAYRDPVSVNATTTESKAIWTGLPKADDNGANYEYTVDETVTMTVGETTYTLQADTQYTAGAPASSEEAGKTIWTINNTFTTVDIPVKKVWTGDTPLADAVRFTLTANSSAEVKDIYGNVIKSTVKLDASNSWTDTTTFVNLPQYTPDGKKIEYRLAETGVLIGVDKAENWHSPNDFFTVSEVRFNQKTQQWEIENTRHEATITIAKVVKGTSTALKGAIFQIKRQLPNETAPALFENTAFTVDQQYGKVLSIQEEGAKVDISGLLPGIYTVTEVKAPSGYIIMASSFTFTIAVDGTVTYSAAGNDGNGLVTYTSKDSESYDTFTVGNEPGVALPATGGVGTGVVYGAGAALVLLALAGFIMLNRKRSRGDGI